MEDVRQWMETPEADRQAFDQFFGKFRAPTAVEHAKALKELAEAQDRIADLEAEIKDIKAHYEKRLAGK